MQKKMILVGLANRSLGWDFFKAVTDSLEKRSINLTRIDCVRLRFETLHTKTWFVFKNDRPQWIEGIRADAIFGSQYKMLLTRTTSDTFIAHQEGVGLVDYICKVEREVENEYRKISDLCVADMYPETMFITAGRRNGKSLYRYLVNATYGKYGQFSSKESMKKEGENIMNAVYNDLINGRPAYLVTDNGDVPVKIDTINTSSDCGSINIEFEGHMLQPNLSDIINRRLGFLKNKPTKLPDIKTVHFSGPVTAVIWADKTKTVVRANDGEFIDYEKGLAMAIAKKALGTNKSGSNYYDIFKKYLPKPKEETA